MRKTILAVAALFLAARANAAVPTSERDALIALYQSTNGSGWVNNTGWNGQPGSECTWFGVTCDDEKANVVALEMPDNNLDGTLSSSIRNFTKLRGLYLASNHIRGALPPEIGELANLEFVYMVRNEFSGKFPAQFGNLKKLTTLDFDENQFNGAIPPQLGDSSALEDLGLSNNHFSGAIPADLARLTNLKVLGLSVNELTGEIPAALGTLPKLERLAVADNQLSGAIPSRLGDLTTLIELRLNGNKLTGGIPASFGKLRALQTLDAGANLLSGPLQPALGDLASLQELFLAENEFSGPLPDSFYRLTALIKLNLGSNDLSGALSPDLAKLVNLEFLGLYYNQFSGTIPPQLASLTQLTDLGLQSNALTGSIPPELGDLSNLRDLDLSGNALTGEIPSRLRLLGKLEGLTLYQNDLEGTIPPELGEISTLRFLHLADNNLHGPIPDGLRRLSNMEQFTVNGNALTGAFPSWIGEWPKLTELFVGSNQLTGTLPAGLATLDNLALLDLSLNDFTGPMVDFTRLTNLVYLTVNLNRFSGPLPSSIGALTKLDYAVFGQNAFSGPLPKEIGNLVNVTHLDLTENDFEGPIPPEIGRLTKANNISLHSNHFSGTLPKELGDLTTLQFLSVSFNALKGPIPAEITRMVGLEDHRSDFAYNGLYANDAQTRDFVNSKHYDGDFEATQTVMPTNIRLVETTDRSATLSWDPIRYNYYGGGYQVTASTTPNGPPTTIATTSSKSLQSITVRNLAPSTQYFFTVSTVSHPISGQENLIVSDRSAPIQGATKARVIAPPDVALIDAPSGMVQIDGVEVEADSFSVTNFGDVATAITLEKNGDFFTLTPAQFQLPAGATQVVVMHSTPQSVGTYYAGVSINGVGAPDDLFVEVVLLSSARPAGSVVATPVNTRIELAGEPGSDQVGTAQFRNSGTARLTGIVLSDQPWVVVPAEPITIEPGNTGSVNFTIKRAKRPEGTEGGLVANLSLVYVTGGESLTFKDIETLDGTSVSISKVTIIDVTKPPTSTGPIPGLGAGELAFFIPGIATSTSSHADVSIINAAGASAINDLKLYFTNGPQTTVAALQPLGFGQGVSLPNLVNSIYGSANATGTLQIRSTQSNGLASEAKVTAVTPGGTYTGAIPVFRGDRSIGTGARLYLTGLTSPGDLFIQETSGGSASIRIELRDAAGNLITSSDQTIAGYALLEVKNAVPANVTTAIIRNNGPGLITAYARLRDASGDTWSVVDWSRFYQFALGDAVRIPYADAAQGGGTRRRAVRPLATAPRSTTDVVLYNPGTSEARATMSVVGASDRAITIGAGATVTVANAASSSSSSVASLVITPTRGEVVVTARTHHAAGGSAIPVLPATAGLRLGQSQVFAGLDDSSSARTSYGLTESSGASVKVRVRIIIDETNPLTATITSRTFSLAAREQVLLPELVRSFAGNARDTLFGDLHNLTLEFEVIEGNGSVVPYVIATDVASGDSNVIVQ